MASSAAQHVLGQLLVPLEAAARLTEWLAATFDQDDGFRSIVLKRVAGDQLASSGGYKTRVSAEVQLTEALKDDDALFAVEEQNLFIDEVREAERWAGVYKSLSWEDGTGGRGHELLIEWMLGGLAQVQRLFAEAQDGPLGWASRPDVFAICSRVLLGSVAMSKNSPHIEQSLVEVRKAMGEHSENNPSPLLCAYLNSIVST